MKLYKFLLFSIGILSLCSCEDIQEKNLAKGTVTLISPLENTSYQTYTQTFWWGQVEGATSYNLQIVKGTFDKPEILVLDTNVTKDKFTFSMSPGSFQWRIRAWNAGSKTPYATWNLKIDTTSITGQKVILASPTNSTTYFSSNFMFSWNQLFGADNYIFQIDTINGNFIPGKMILSDTISTAYWDKSSFTKQSGKFKWRVQGKNATVYSLYSDIGSFVISSDIPSISATKISGSNASLSWNPLEGAQKYEIHIKTTDKKYVQGFPKTITTTSFDFKPTDTSVKKYIWSIKGIDGFGSMSDTAEFTPINF